MTGKFNDAAGTDQSIDPEELRPGTALVSTGRFEDWSNFQNYVKRCTRKGAHVGSNADARSRALADLHDFLTRVLGN